MATSTHLKPRSTEPPAFRRRPTPAKTARVLHVINGEHYSGAERVQDLLAGALPEMGFEVALACLKPDRFPKVRKHRAARLYEMPMRNRFDLRSVGRLVQLIRREDFRILHAHTPRTLLVAALASIITGAALVYHVHSPTSRDSTRRWRNRANAWIEWLGLLTTSATIAVSQSLGEHTRRNGPNGRKVTVVPNGVPGRPPRSARPLGEQAWTLGTVALFRPRKGVEVLLETLAKLRSEGLSVRLRAVGGFETPDYEREVKQLTEKLGLADAVDWTGFTEDVDAEWARIDLFVLPSLFGEGLPMVVLEAMAAGVPVVATRVEGVPEAIRDEEEGLLAEPGDSHSLAQAVGRVVRGEVEWFALRERALKRHAERFSDRSMAAGVAEVYRRVLADG
jgi:glycosyltransferase involved in cell wall biosynthesis